MNYMSALQIAYPLRDTVASDTARYLREQERMELEQEEIEHIAVEILHDDAAWNSLHEHVWLREIVDEQLKIAVRSTMHESKVQAMREIVAAYMAAAILDAKQQIKNIRESA